MTPALPALSKLTHLQDLFGTLIRGRHVNRLQDGAWWNELERERETYEALFAQLGYQLLVDERGFAWFQSEEPAVNIANKTRNLALLMLALFERQADQGINLTRFYEWRVDGQLIEEIMERNRTMLEAEGLASVEHLETTMAIATSYGFAALDQPRCWRLLPATWRYLDAFEQLATHHDEDESIIAEDAT